MWNRDLKLKIIVISMTAAAAFALLVVHGMRFDFASAGATIGTVALLLPFAVVFNQRKISQFANLLIGFLCMVVFNLSLAVLTYAGTPLNAPLADNWLIQADASMGIHLPSIVAWSKQHTWMTTFNMAYNTVLPSTLLALVILGFDSDVRRLRDFVTHFMLAGLATTVIYFSMPAIAPTAAFGYEATDAQSRFLAHFTALRAGEFPIVSMNNLEGLITFPSFHTTWAILVAWSFRPYRWLFPPMMILNAAVAVSTVTTGWHYATDVIGGCLVAAGSILLTHFAKDWLHHDISSTAVLPTPA